MYCSIMEGYIVASNPAEVARHVSPGTEQVEQIFNGIIDIFSKSSIYDDTLWSGLGSYGGTCSSLSFFSMHIFFRLL